MDRESFHVTERCKAKSFVENFIEILTNSVARNSSWSCSLMRRPRKRIRRRKNFGWESRRSWLFDVDEDSLSKLESKQTNKSFQTADRLQRGSSIFFSPRNPPWGKNIFKIWEETPFPGILANAGAADHNAEDFSRGKTCFLRVFHFILVRVDIMKKLGPGNYRRNPKALQDFPWRNPKKAARNPGREPLVDGRGKERVRSSKVPFVRIMFTFWSFGSWNSTLLDCNKMSSRRVDGTVIHRGSPTAINGPVISS